ncbi:MAG: DNA polymerase III subunit chi [Hyphomicrobiaceae bacterium]
MTATLPEVLFYHLERAPLEGVLPSLLEKTLERGWRAVVQTGTSDRLEALDEVLWTYRPESFLPHGSARDGNAESQPVYLTTGTDTPNGAGVRFLVDGADPESYAGYTRMVFMFDGNNPDAVAQARTQWKAVKAAGCIATYWQQNESGRWTKKA